MHLVDVEFLIIEFVLNALLLSLYVKALHQFAIDRYFDMNETRKNLNGDTKLIDTRQHELMIEATRHTVLFSTVLIASIVTLWGFSVSLFCMLIMLHYQIQNNMELHSGISRMEYTPAG